MYFLTLYFNKMKNKLILMSSALLLATFFSCQNQEEEIMSSPNEQEVLSSGFVGPVVKGKSIFSTEKLKNNSRRQNAPIIGKWQKITSDHVNDMSKDAKYGFNRAESATKRAAEVFGSGSVLPIGVFVNDHKAGYGTNPNPIFFWSAEFRPNGALALKDESTSEYTEFKRAHQFRTLSKTNYSDKEQMLYPPGDWSEATKSSITWTVTGSISTTAGGKIGLPLVAEGSVSVTIRLTAGGSGTDEYTVTNNIKPTKHGVLVPPGKTAKWSIYERHKNFEAKWSVPLEFKGDVGVDYGAGQYKGHHFYRIPAKEYFREFDNGNKNYVVNIDTHLDPEYRVFHEIVDN